MVAIYFHGVVFVGFQGLCLNGWFVRDDVLIRVAFLCVCFEIGDLQRWAYVFCVFCLGVFKVIHVFLSGLLCLFLFCVLV